jgi:hypothetical protein
MESQRDIFRFHIIHAKFPEYLFPYTATVITKAYHLFCLYVFPCPRFFFAAP